MQLVADKKIKLVLSGSGTKYPVFVGAVQALVERGYQFSEVCGTSGGSLIAACIASGLTPADMRVLVKRVNPAALIDINLFPWGPSEGLIKGNKFLRQLRSELPETFEEAHKKSGIHLNVVTFNIERGTHVIWGSRFTGKADLPLCVRASISIPFVFNAVPLRPVSDGRPEATQLHVDGGVGANFPLDIFGVGDDVIGLRFRPQSRPRPINSKLGYAMAVIDGMIESSTREHTEDAIHARQIYLDSDGGGLDFNLTPDKIEQLIDDGYNSARKALDRAGTPVT